ncbi:MAG: hypothetical protein ACOY4K_04020 [Pseudomonadota bacterium]
MALATGTRRTIPVVIAGLALGASMVLHLWLVAGVQALRPTTFEPTFRDSGILLDCPPGRCEPERLFRWPSGPSAPDGGALPAGAVEPLPLPGPGWADISCRVGRGRYFEECHWIRESEPGFGDAALYNIMEARPTDRAVPGQIVTFRVTLNAYPTE